MISVDDTWSAPRLKTVCDGRLCRNHQQFGGGDCHNPSAYSYRWTDFSLPYDRAYGTCPIQEDATERFDCMWSAPFSTAYWLELVESNVRRY